VQKYKIFAGLWQPDSDFSGAVSGYALYLLSVKNGIKGCRYYPG